jgi:hypothetical protein
MHEKRNATKKKLLPLGVENCFGGFSVVSSGELEKADGSCGRQEKGNRQKFPNL